MNIMQRAIRVAIEESPMTLAKGIAEKLKLPTKHHIVYKDILGSVMKLDTGGKGIHRELLAKGIREVKATRYLAHILNYNMTVIDIGANIGYYALQEAKVCKQVYAIEPAPDNYERLVENIKLNNYSNINTHNVAIGDKSGSIQFKLSPAPNWHRVAIGTDNNTITIPIMTLDELIGNKTVDLVRMDVEGYELNILKGMTKTIKKNSLWLFIETHKQLIKEFGGSLREFYEILAEHNFTLRHSIIRGNPGITGNMRNLVNNKRLYKGLGSWLFLKKEKED